MADFELKLDLALESIAKKTDPKKWSSAKAAAKKKMGGKWSARAAQLATSIYKKRGGGYKGPKKSDNSLSKWTKEDWQYSDESKESKPKSKRGRYLPKSAWSSLTPSEKASTSAAKNKGTKAGKQFVKQPKKIAKKTARHRS